VFSLRSLRLCGEKFGEIMDIKADAEALGDNRLPEMGKVKSFLFDPANRGYYGFGEYFGKAFSIGKELTQK